MKKKLKSTVELTVTMIPLSEIKVKENLNPRLTLPNLEELEESIALHGIQEPLKVYQDDSGDYIVVKGHRRRQATMNLAEKDAVDPESILIPCLQYSGVPDDESILRDHVISNSGVPFTAIEKAEIVNRYEMLGIDLTKTAKQMSLTYQQAWNLKHLHSAPEPIKELINANLVSSTLVVEEFKKDKNFDDMLETFKIILLEGAAKITSKKVKEIQDRSEQEEEENEEKLKNSFNSESEAPSKIKMEFRIQLFVEELKLQYDDRFPERNKEIDRIVDLMADLQSGTEISLIISTLIPKGVKPSKKEPTPTLKASSEDVDNSSVDNTQEAKLEAMNNSEANEQENIEEHSDYDGVDIEFEQTHPPAPKKRKPSSLKPK